MTSVFSNQNGVYEGELNAGMVLRLATLGVLLFFGMFTSLIYLFPIRCRQCRRFGVRLSYTRLFCLADSNVRQALRELTCSAN
jgi:hypothetical protein